ncbi:hypothetical protein B0H13DRAFT_1863961 [Mycena leptocephala]|nr:hypothetical protein B0H13DRAFT_1863961 [Mycena leptocephala]
MYREINLQDQKDTPRSQLELQGLGYFLGINASVWKDCSRLMMKNDRDELEYWVVDAKRKRCGWAANPPAAARLRQGTNQRHHCWVFGPVTLDSAGSDRRHLGATYFPPGLLATSYSTAVRMDSAWSDGAAPFLTPPIPHSEATMRRGSTMRFKCLRPGSFTIGYHDGRSDSERAPVLGKSAKALTSRGTYDSHTTRIYGWPQTTFVVAYWTRASWNVCVLHRGMYLWPLWHYTALSTTVKYQSVFQMLYMVIQAAFGIYRFSTKS